MKKKRFIYGNNKILLTLLGLALFTGCKKENFKKINQQTTISESSNISFDDLPEIKQRDGMLEFATQKEYYSTINTFAEMSEGERILWGQQNNFKTQQIIFDEICQAEDEFDELYFDGLPDTISEEELNRIGKRIEFSRLYNFYLQKGLIKQLKDSSGFSFYLNTLDELAAYVLNENNMCLVNDTLYFYNNKSKKFIQKPYININDTEQITRVESSEQCIECLIFELDGDRGNTSFYIDNIWTQSGNLASPLWYYESSNERFRHYVSLGSSHYNDNLYCTFVTRAEAEKKKHGKWRRRLGFKPIDYIQGSWDYWYTNSNGVNITNSLGSLDNNNNESSGYIDNPNWMKNKIQNYLEPTGTFTITGVMEAVHIENMHIKGYFICNTGSYYTNYYK